MPKLRNGCVIKKKRQSYLKLSRCIHPCAEGIEGLPHNRSFNNHIKATHVWNKYVSLHFLSMKGRCAALLLVVRPLWFKGDTIIYVKVNVCNTILLEQVWKEVSPLNISKSDLFNTRNCGHRKCLKSLMPQGNCEYFC